MRLLAFPRYERLGSSSRVRLYQHMPHLAAAGIETAAQALLGDDYVRGLNAGKKRVGAAFLRRAAARAAALRRAGAGDLVWIERELFPWLPGWAEAGLARRGIPYVLDLDDAWFHRYDRHPSAAVRKALGGKVDRIMRGAALVVAGSPYIAARAGAAGARRVARVPSVVDPATYPPRRERGDGTLRLVWIGSRASTPYLAAIAGPLATLAGERPVTLLLIGAGPVALPGVPVERREWDEASEAALLAGCDIGLMPLPDTPFERGKCGYKLLQYMAAGLPAIASPVGVNVEIATPDTGLLVSGPAEWLAALRRLAADPEARARLGAAGRARVERDFALPVWGPRLAALLLDAAGRR